MRSAVEAGESPVGINKANDECNAVGGPSCVVREVGKDNAGLLMGGRLRRDRDEDDQEGEEGGVEGGLGDGGEDFAVAVEEKAE